MMAAPQERQEILEMAARLAMTDRAPPPSTYAKLNQDPFWKGILYRVRKSGMGNQEIEDIIKRVPSIKSLMQDVKKPESPTYVKNDPTNNFTQTDAIAKHVLDFRPEEVARLPSKMQDQILRSWIQFQRGRLEAPIKEFDTKYISAMKKSNAKLIEAAKTH